MDDMLKNLPIEERFVEQDVEGKIVLIPALNRTWVKLLEKNFARYIGHPDPGHKDYVSDRAQWLEITHYVVEDLEWLLRQEHHIFWSHMIYSMEAQWLVLTFLQEAPPYYMRNEFPKDEEMEYYLAKAEHLVFLVLRRLATKKESPEHHIKNFGDLLYNSYLFTIPMFFDIFLIYGYKNRELVAKLFYDVVSVSPKFLHDLGVVPHFFLKILQMVKEKFDITPVAVLTEKHKQRPDFTKNVFLHLVDTTASMQIFFDINLKFAKCMRAETFLSEIAFFYTYVIPKIYDFVKADSACDYLKVKLDFVRLNLLAVVRSIFVCTLNDVVNDDRFREENANEYLTRLMDLTQEPLFISDYNKVYPIENDLKMLVDLCPNMDTINLKYISDAVASCSITKYKPQQLKEFRLASLISEVRDVLPHLGDGFVEFCLRFYDFDTERVLSAVLEDNLPPSLDKLDRNMQRPNQIEHKIIVARINAEKQYRMDKATSNGVKTEEKTDEVKTRSESEKVDKPGTSGGSKQKADKGGTNGKGKQKADKAGTNGKGKQKADKPGTSAESEQNLEKPEASAECEQNTGKPAAGGKGKQKADKQGTSGKGKQKADKQGTGGKGKQKADKSGTSAESEQNLDKPGTSAGSEQNLEKPEASAECEQNTDKPVAGGKGEQNTDKPVAGGKGEQNTDKPVAGGKGEQNTDKPVASGKGKQKADKQGTSGKGKQKADKPGTSAESEQNLDKPGTSGGSKARNERAGTNKDVPEFFIDKPDLLQGKGKALNYARRTEIYDDEYDDTYDYKSLLVKEGRNVDEDKKTVGNRKVVRNQDGEIEEKSSGEEDDSPERIRSRLLQRRMDKLRRDFMTKKKAQIQERELLVNRRFKDVNKAAIANHNRKKLAAKKRNMN